MDIKNSSLYTEIEKITQELQKPVLNYWTAEIHIKDKTYKPLKVISFDVVRDYQKAISDECIVKLLIPLGKWAKLIYPNRANLEISLFQTPLLETVGGENKELPIYSQRYLASPVLEGLPVAEGSDINRLSEDILDLRSILEINFQLMSKSIDKLRLVAVGGTFRDNTTENVIKSILTNESNKVKVDTGPAVEAIEMVNANNKDIKKHIIVPQGTPLVNVANYIQDNCGGVYTAGLSAYLQDKTWYVYPPYDTTRLNKTTKTLTVIKVPKNFMTGIERSYRVSGDSIFLLASSEASFDDDAGTNLLNYGNGIRFSNADNFLDGLVTTKDNKTVIERSKNNSEFIATKNKGRNFVPISSDNINSNPFKEYSRIAAIIGGTYQFVWDHSNPNLLFPGMMVRILFLNGDIVDELSGVLMYVHSTSLLNGPASTAVRHNTNSALVIYVNKNTKKDTSV